ncbi:MAG: hypothetical protein DWQ02_15155 [Bacteroidetes bacterium]|nr:MAG: hypothetical protein DWQ02_15155 [Bacteroidota bacterium]
MNKTITILFRIIFLSFLTFQIQTQAQTITLDYTPPEPICSFDEEGCTGEVNFPFGLLAENGDGITVSHQISLDGEMPVEDVYGSLSGIFPDYMISGSYPIGQHTMVVTAIQGNDTLVADMEFSVVDCVAPWVICINGWTVALQLNGTGCCSYEVPITDLIYSSEFDCTEPLNYSVYRLDEIESGINPLATPLNTIVFDCNDIEVVLLNFYVWDNAFNPYSIQPDGSVGGPNYDYCPTYALVYNSSSCQPDPFFYEITGSVKTEIGEGVEGVEIQVTGGDFVDALTETSGEFELNVHPSGPITITPHLDLGGFPFSGMSTLDRILIQKHILGIQALDSPYKMIAADVNNSATITASDIIQMRKLILGIFVDFPNNTLWRFVDADYVFPNPANPWVEEFPEVVEIENPWDQINNVDFIAIKIGDVSYN